MSTKTLALLGGTPVRAGKPPIPEWPVYDEGDAQIVAEAVRSGRWGGFPELSPYALRLADEVIIPGYTFAATWAVLAVGAIPVFADIDPQTYCISPDSNDIAHRHLLFTVDDAAYTHRSKWHNKGAGSTEQFRSFSLQSSKTLTTSETGILRRLLVAVMVFTAIALGIEEGNIAHANGSVSAQNVVSPAPTTTVEAVAQSLFLTSTLRASPPAPTAVNGLPLTTFVWMPAQVRENIQRIYTEGQKRGNIPGHFSAIGDSSIAGGQFLERFAKGPYKLGDYAHLQDVINAYSPSFSRTSTSVRIGLHSWTALNPAWANKQVCKPNESAVACEIRIQQPSVVFIRLGANDSPVSLFEKSMRSIISYTVESGVVPILITKANAAGAITNANNGVLRKLSQEFKVPLIDFEALAATLPGRGLGNDAVHMTGYSRVDYTLPSVFRSGHAMHNLAALIGLDKVWRAMRGGQAGTP